MEIPVMGASGKRRLFQSLLWSSHCMQYVCMYVYSNCCYTTHCNAAAPNNLMAYTLLCTGIRGLPIVVYCAKVSVGYRLIVQNTTSNNQQIPNTSDFITQTSIPALQAPTQTVIDWSLSHCFRRDSSDFNLQLILFNNIR